MRHSCEGGGVDVALVCESAVERVPRFGPWRGVLLFGWMGFQLLKEGAFGPVMARAVADKMGAALSRLNSRDKHQQFSQDLAGFAESAKQIVNNDHNGVLIYAGGDDVLAFGKILRGA